MEALPRFVVFGGPVPEALRVGLEGAAELYPGGAIPDAEASGVVLHAGADVHAGLRAFRDAGGSLPVYGWSDAPVGLDARLRWIREGGDDLVGGAEGAAHLRRRLEETPDAAIGARVDRWTTLLARYLRARDQFGLHTDGDGAKRWADALRLRDGLLAEAGVPFAGDPAARSTALPVGERGPGANQPAVASTGMGAAAIVDGVPLPIRALGADGLVVICPEAPRVGARMEVELRGARRAARLDAEVRWIEPRGEAGWDVGLRALRCELDPVPTRG
jgi:hypothetical protein